MSKLIERIKALVPIIKGQKDLDDAYLARSVDVYDLERRMHEIDLRGCSATRRLTFGPVSYTHLTLPTIYSV